VQNNNTVQLLVDATKTRLISPNNTNYLDVDDGGLTYTEAGISRLFSNNSTLSLFSPNGLTNFIMTNTSHNLAVNNITRQIINLTGGYLYSPSSLSYSAVTNTQIVHQVGTNTNTAMSASSYGVTVSGDQRVSFGTDSTLLLGGVHRVHIDASHTQLISPNGLQAVEANNTGVQINLNSDNYKLPTTRGTVGQVLTYSGVNTTWATPSITPGAAINSGWGYLPMSSITATATAATRSFYYISMVPMNTVITGIKAYINTPGADFINCAIYRGKSMVAGSHLVMTSGRVTVLSVCDVDEYMTLPLTLQAGQSNQFAAGEYVTICFHSSGSGAVYYICAAAPANLGISYISTACYAAAGTPTFPANLSLITASTTNTIRTHFEFY
jgi:hypothetical protein